MATLMNKEELGQWILRRLGAPMVKIELTQEHLEDSIERATRWLAAKKGILKKVMLPMVPTVNEYKLPDVVNTVTDVNFSAAKLDLSLLAAPWFLPEQLMPYNALAVPESGGLYSHYTQIMQHIEMAKRVLGAEQDWRQDGRTLYIFPVPQVSGTIILDYTSHQVVLDELNERDHDLVKRYALARTKEDLGHVRSKYNEFATAQGSATLDGERLLEEAKAEIEALEEEISQSGYPMGIIIG